MTREVNVAVLQCSMGPNRAANVEQVLTLVRRAAGDGAHIVLPPELFEGEYFPREEKEEFFEWAAPLQGNRTIDAVSSLCRELGIVVPVSFFERAGQAFYNSVAVVDADGTVLGCYRKSHIPDGPGYEEKFYFRPGETGFRVWDTRHGRIGVGICWDQWFPEAARIMSLQGAEILLYPTAIGSEPHEPDNDTRGPWQRCMIGHAVANAIPVMAANRTGQEGELHFYGSSFVCDHRGEKLGELGRDDHGVLLRSVDLEAARRYRAAWGFFRDRRPDLYGALGTADGSTAPGTVPALGD